MMGFITSFWPTDDLDALEIIMILGHLETEYYLIYYILFYFIIYFIIFIFLIPKCHLMDPLKGGQATGPQENCPRQRDAVR
jgi:phosphotransferase system  glucose/maltose/N-acetylglucosamine-specific IIC component